MTPAPIPPSRPPVLAEARLARRESLGGESWWLDLALAAPAPEAAPGQFYMLRGREGWPVLLARPFSLAWRGAGGRELGFLVEAAGRGSRALASLAEGALVTLWGPLGNAFPALPGAVLVAGGVGLAPFLLYCQDEERRRRCRLLFGGRNREALAAAAKAPPGTALELATDDGSLGFRGTVVGLLAARLESGQLPAGSPLLVCGPWRMMAAAARLAEARGLPCLVSVETHMGCGVGICTGCGVRLRTAAPDGRRTVLACRQGPVFPGEAVEWAEEG